MVGQEGGRGVPERARRLAVVAGSVLAAALASLPFAGSGGEEIDRLATVAGSPSVRAPASVPTAPQAAIDAPYLAPSPAPAPEPEAPAPPPPPPIAAASMAPDQGVVAGDAPPIAVATAAALPAPGPDPGRTTTGVADATPGRRVWAVVIGIDDYPGVRSDLRAAAADARDLSAALLRFGVPADQIRAVYDRAGSIDGILAAVDWLVTNAGPEDTAVFLYAGHVRDLGRGTEAIVTAENGWVTDWFLAERFASLRARDAWFVIAGCYGGGFDELLGPGRVLTAAAGPGELAYETDDYGRSYLAEYVFNRALIGGAAEEPTVQSSVAWAMERLAEEHPARQLWNRDDAGHPISLDGVRRDGSPQPGAPPPPEPPAPAAPTPPDSGVLGPEGCLLGLVGTC